MYVTVDKVFSVGWSFVYDLSVFFWVHAYTGTFRVEHQIRPSYILYGDASRVTLRNAASIKVNILPGNCHK